MPWYGRKRKNPPAAKEEAAEPATSSPATGRRKSLRTSTGTAEKSKYFDPEPESDSDGKPKRKSSKPAKAGRPSKKAKREEDDDELASSDDDAPPPDSELDEDEVPKVTFEPLPKLRDTNGIEYQDDRLHQNTLEFLKDLKKNNKRTWLKTNDEEFRRSLKDWESYVMTMTEKIMAADETIPELPFKDVNFRIYRDVRFSHDPTPYKPNYGAAWSRTGRKGPYACYYLHLEPGGKCLVGGGLWHPPADMIAKIRTSIDTKPKAWRKVLMDPNFRDVFLGDAAPPSKVKGKKATTPAEKKGRGRPAAKSTTEEAKEVEKILQEHDETSVIKAFAELNKESALKIRPQGYQPDHRDIELLKLRSFTVSKKIPDDMFTYEDGQEEIARIFGAMVGFVTFLNKIVMPDPGDEDGDSDEE
ncbi:hypothetical protein QBC37DRAFT_415156 [Rhypophila decipiens]|uniref:Uncharacterized protein n=1 Tax=Rhypophila decipiens TaxID=261697 RepID=A0AAN6YIC5_9PEZI|nr:hypothetical protein QBC37DRAFT_415156 [Rhypophila decipiens]